MLCEDYLYFDNEKDNHEDFNFNEHVLCINQCLI